MASFVKHLRESKACQGVPFAVDRKKDTIKVSASDSISHIKMIVGSKGKPLKIVKLPGASFPGLPFLDRTQYETILRKHEGNEEIFEDSGTNGFTAKTDVDSEEGPY